MGFRKTRWNRRGTYTFESVTGEKIVMRPGEKEVTEADIKLLHSMDDAMVYNDITNSRPPMSDEEKERKRLWEEEHPGEKYPANWNLSLDYMAGEDDDSPDKSRLMASCCVYDEYGEESEEELMDELTKKHLPFLTPIQRKVFYLREVGEYTGKEVAAMLRVSEANVSNSNGNKGIACGLNNLQKIRDGEPLGGKSSAEDDFADGDEDDFLG